LLNSVSKDKNLKPVLFVICMKNYKSYHSFRLNDAKYTAHPYEQEYIMMEGILMHLMKVEEIHIKTANWIYRELNDRLLTIIHLLHPCQSQIS